MIKVAYISSAYLADCDLPLLQEMAKQGADVYYFLQMSDDSRQATVINVQKVLPTGGLFPASRYPDLAHLANYLSLDHVYVINMPTPHDYAPSVLKAYWQTYQFVRKNHFGVVHVTSPLRYGAFLLYALHNKMVMTMHDPLPHSSDLGFMNRFHRYVAFRMVKNFIVLSDSLKQGFINTYNLNKKKVCSSRLGVYNILNNVTPAEIQLPSDYILYVGSINPHKGIRYLCEAMTQIAEKHPDINLVIAGRGQFDFDVEAYIKNYPIKLINRFVTEGELETLVRNSQFVVCPYVDATQSGVIMSAFALNKPVLATRVGALSEMLTDGRHGLLVSPRDADALAEGIMRMLQPDVLPRMTNNINDDYNLGERSWQQIAHENLDIYNKVQ